MAVSEPEKYAETITSRTMEPARAPVEGSSKNGDLVLLRDVQLYGFPYGVSTSTQNHFKDQFAAEIAQYQQCES